MSERKRLKTNKGTDGSVPFLDIYTKADIAELPSFPHSVKSGSCFTERVHAVDNGTELAAVYQFQHIREFLIASH